MTSIDQYEFPTRLVELTDLLSAGCDPDFDGSDDLEREFQELRLQLSSFQ